MIYAIDMDGVIIDSYQEQIVDSYNTYRKFSRGTKIFDNQELSLDNYKQILNKNKSTLRKFDKIYPFAKAAEEIVTLFYMIDNKIIAKDDVQFRDILAKIPHRKLVREHNELYRQRYMFEKHKNWQKIIKPFDNVLDFVRKNAKNSVILSNKDKKTIKLILDYYGLEISDNRIYSMKLTTDKNKKLRLIKNRFKVKYSDIHFIDDKFINLMYAVKLGVKCYLATWGCSNSQQRRKAKRMGINLLSLKSISRLNIPS